MAKPPASGHTTTSDNLQTWILRVYIHCEGCKKKVFKVLQSIDGVYKTVIDAKEHKATVTGSVNGEVLVQKLLKSGKHAEILPQSFAATAANSKKKKKQNDVVKIADDTEQVNDEKTESKGSTGKNIQEIADPDVASGGGKKKKIKKKAGKNDNNAPANSETEVLPTGNPATGTGVPVENVGDSMGQLNLGVPMPQTGYSAPYGLPPNHNYYPTPAYGVSYSTTYPSAESSYYTPPVYGYAQSHPSVFYHPPPNPPGYGRSAFDDHDDDLGEGRWCAIM